MYCQKPAMKQNTGKTFPTAYTWSGRSHIAVSTRSGRSHTVVSTRLRSSHTVASTRLRSSLTSIFIPLDFLSASSLNLPEPNCPGRSHGRKANCRSREHGFPAEQPHHPGRNQIRRQRPYHLGGYDINAVFHFPLFFHHFRKNTDDRRLDHGLGVSVDPPDGRHQQEPPGKSHQKIHERRGGQSGEDHFSRMHPVAQQAVAQLPDPVGKKINHINKPRLASRQYRILNHYRHG